MLRRILGCPAPLGSSLVGDGDEADDEDRDGEEMELPPLDEDDEGDGARDPDGADGPLDFGADDEAGLDDAVADDLDDGVRLADEEAPMSASDREAADDEVDVGALDEGIDLEEEAPMEDDRAEGDGGADDDDLELADEPDDGGAEGTNDDPEDAVDEAALPALDADDDGTGDESALADALLDDAHGPPGDPPSWSIVEGAGAFVPCSSVVASGGRVVASGEALLVVSDGLRAAQRASDAGPIVAVAVDGDLLAFATRRGPLRISLDLGVSSTEVSGFGVRGKAGEADAIQLAATAGRIWILEGGALWSLAIAAERPAPVRKTSVRRIAATDGALVMLALLDDGAPAVERLRGDDERWAAVRLTGDAAAIATSNGARFSASAGGKALALADARKVVVSRDGGQVFETTPLAGVEALVFAGAGVDAPLFALLGPDRAGRSALMSLDAEGRTTRLADLGGARTSVSRDDVDADPQGDEPLGLAWDDTRDLVWVASAAGLTALSLATRH